MKDHSAPVDDPWASLADELGVTPTEPPKAAAKPHREVHKLREETPVPVVSDETPESEELPEESDGAEEEGTEGAEAGPGDGVEPGKKRRRRRRRGKKKVEGDAPGAEGADGAEEVAPPSVGIAAAETPGEDGSAFEGGAFEEEAEPESDDPHLAVALDEEMEADTNHDKPTWKVTSWKELVAGLHRPDR